jgi:hypothetical protein
MVAALLHRHRIAEVAHDDDAVDRRALGEGIVDIGLQRHQPAAALAAVGGDDGSGCRNPSIRPCSASGEKPPKTTLWTAPIRAQASIATAASGSSACRG